MRIDNGFKNYYLTVGVTYDNFIFENCPLEFIEYAYECLNSNLNDVNSCCIKINDEIEKKLDVILDKCEEDSQRNILARTFFVSVFAYELLKDKNVDIKNLISLAELKEGIEFMLSGDFNVSKEFYLKSPMPYDIKRIINKIGKIELNVFLVNTSNVYLQSVINLFVSSREPYSVKIFTNSKRLPSYSDVNGVLIESPHDYMRVDVNKFINLGMKNR